MITIMRIAFLHGLESPAISDKTDFLHANHDAYCPALDYTNKEVFNKTLEEIKEFKPDFISGSSMGGYLAFAISSNTGIPCLLFNPALHSRTIDLELPIGEHKFKSMFVLGKEDDIINPEKTIRTLGDKKFIHSISAFGLSFEEMGHRIPIEIFEKNVKLFEKLMIV